MVHTTMDQTLLSYLLLAELKSWFWVSVLDFTSAFEWKFWFYKQKFGMKV